MSEKKTIGRPKLPPEKRRTARLSMRTYPAVAVKAALLGTAAVEDLILKSANARTIKARAGLVDRLRSPWHHGDCRAAADEIERLQRDLAQMQHYASTLMPPAAVDVAVAAERERCANLCDDEAAHSGLAQTGRVLSGLGWRIRRS